ncbi:TPA: PKD domain-containing protein, partial [Thermoplasmata archaeon]|nr:PKD domain-containing protein [Thermoplasmata archaeon]
MNESSDSVASRRDGRRAVYSIAVVTMLVMVSGAAVIASSGGLLSRPLDSSALAVSTGLVIADVTPVPDEAYVDEEVVWTVVVDLQDQGQRGKGLLFTWDWDDGTYTVHHLNSINNSDTAIDVQTHAWPEAGAYEVTVSVWDGYGSEKNKFHNVSETVQYDVNEGSSDRMVDYRWYDMFAHELGSWYEDRLLYYGSEYA